MKPAPESPRFEPGPEIRASDRPSAFEEHVRAFVQEPLLRPVLFVLIAHLMAAFAPILISAVRDTRPWALVGLVPIVIGSFQVVYGDLMRHGRPAVFSGLVIAVWVSAIAGAIAADHWNLY